MQRRDVHKQTLIKTIPLRFYWKFGKNKKELQHVKEKQLYAKHYFLVPSKRDLKKLNVLSPRG